MQFLFCNRLLCSNYVIAEAKELAKIGINDALIKKIQRFTKKYSEQEIDRATYQSMEAFVHNLNTMHSRAGAQIPFSSFCIYP